MTERTELQKAIDEAVQNIMFHVRIELNTLAIKALDVSEAAAHAAIAGMEARVKGETNEQSNASK